MRVFLHGSFSVFNKILKKYILGQIHPYYKRSQKDNITQMGSIILTEKNYNQNWVLLFEKLSGRL